MSSDALQWDNVGLQTRRWRSPPSSCLCPPRAHHPSIQIHDSCGIPVPLWDGELILYQILRPVSFPKQFPSPDRYRLVHESLLYALYRIPVHTNDSLDSVDRHVEAQKRDYTRGGTIRYPRLGIPEWNLLTERPCTVPASVSMVAYIEIPYSPEMNRHIPEPHVVATINMQGHLSSALPFLLARRRSR